MTDTNTSGADVLAVLGLADARTGSRAVGHDGPDRDEWEDYVEVPSGKLAEFAALIARNAELEAERDEAACLASDVVGSLRIIKDVVASIAAERDALAAEVKALREDAERWQEVARRYDASTTSRAVMVLQGLGLEETPYRSFAENIDAARASAATGEA